MFGPEDVRLLRENWPNATMLAEELYALFQSAMQADQPQTLTAPAGSSQPMTNYNLFGDGGQGIQFKNNQGQPAGGLYIAGDTLVLQTTGTLPTTPQQKTTPPAPTTGGGGIPGVVVSGTASTYVVTIYPNGLLLPSMNVTVKQLQIDSGETIPAGTWTIVTKIGANYYMQVPVWLDV